MSRPDFRVKQLYLEGRVKYILRYTLLIIEIVYSWNIFQSYFEAKSSSVFYQQIVITLNVGYRILGNDAPIAVLYLTLKISFESYIETH